MKKRGRLLENEEARGSPTDVPFTVAVPPSLPKSAVSFARAPPLPFPKPLNLAPFFHPSSPLLLFLPFFALSRPLFACFRSFSFLSFSLLFPLLSTPCFFSLSLLFPLLSSFSVFFSSVPFLLYIPSARRCDIHRRSLQRIAQFARYFRLSHVHRLPWPSRCLALSAEGLRHHEGGRGR